MALLILLMTPTAASNVREVSSLDDEAHRIEQESQGRHALSDRQRQCRHRLQPKSMQVRQQTRKSACKGLKLRMSHSKRSKPDQVHAS